MKRMKQAIERAYETVVKFVESSKTRKEMIEMRKERLAKLKGKVKKKHIGFKEGIKKLLEKKKKKKEQKEYKKQLGIFKKKRKK